MQAFVAKVTREVEDTCLAVAGVALPKDFYQGKNSSGLFFSSGHSWLLLCAFSSLGR